MIVPTMTYKEIYDELDKDKFKIKLRIDKIYPKVVKEFKKLRTFPLMHVDEYKIPATNNQYVIFYYAEKANEIEMPYYTYFGVVFSDNHRFVLFPMERRYQHTPKCDFVDMPQVHVFTSHFLQRYNERYLHNNNLNANQVAGIYILRNWDVITVSMNEEINKKFKEYGESNKHAVRVHDGFCFTETALQYKPSEDGKRENDELYAMMYKYKTFVSERELTDGQKDAIDKEHLELFKYCIENDAKESN